jgi:hypothetical protein
MKVLIFSPQHWDHIKVSKHHYALAFAEENEVYYINPCGSKIGWDFIIEKSTDNPNLNIANYKIPLSGFLKFKWSSLYKKVIEKFLKLQFTKFGNFDLVIDFGCYQFFDSLDFVNAKHKIYFPVDDNVHLGTSKRGAHKLFTVSHIIQKKFQKNGIECEWINHGLSKEFIQIARENQAFCAESNNIKVGYSGNLMIPFLDIPVLKEIIRSHPEIEFNFFGEPTKMGISKKMDEWHLFLNAQENIILHGKLDINELASGLSKMDAFIFCYKPDYIHYHAENSHKILEYLSTGKVIISTWLSVYEDFNLYPMTEKNRNEDLLALFNDVIANLSFWNSNEFYIKRKLFALKNTYKENVLLLTQLL